MIYVISKSTFGSYSVRDIQCNANWDCCPYSDYALIPDNLVEGILATKGYCDITLDSAGTAVSSFTARTIPSVQKECCSEASTATTPKTATGSTITEDDSICAPLIGLKLYGKTTQDGTPTPETPVELVTPGASGSITVTLTDGTDSNVQTLTAQTPNGLPGIPVASGGNYTDANGQAWICDEIDFARGVYVQRVREVDFATLSWKRTSYSNEVQKGYYAKVTGFYNSRNNFFHTHYRWLGYASGSGAGSNSLGTTQSVFNARTIGEIGFLTKAEGQDYFGVVVGINDGTPVGTLQLVRAEPIETPLTAEELAQYAAMHTNKPETTVYNDAGVDMEVSYFVSNAAVPVEAGSANEGKFLRVVNGVATWATVNTAEGASF